MLLALLSAVKRKPLSVLLNLLPRVPKACRSDTFFTNEKGVEKDRWDIKFRRWMQNEIWWMYATLHL